MGRAVFVTQPPEAALERVLCSASPTSPRCTIANKRCNVGEAKRIRVMGHNSSDPARAVRQLAPSELSAKRFRRREKSRSRTRQRAVRVCGRGCSACRRHSPPPLQLPGRLVPARVPTKLFSHPVPTPSLPDSAYSRPAVQNRGPYRILQVSPPDHRHHHLRQSRGRAGVVVDTRQIVRCSCQPPAKLIS